MDMRKSISAVINTMTLPELNRLYKIILRAEKRHTQHIVKSQAKYQHP